MNIPPRPMTGPLKPATAPLKPATGPIEAAKPIQIVMNDQTTLGGNNIGRPKPPR